MPAVIEPRRCLAKPSEFGRSPNPAWRHDVACDARTSAEEQHRYAYVVRQAAKRTFGSVRLYCASTGQDYQRVGRMLRGQTRMQVDDLRHAADDLGVSFVFAPKAETSHRAVLAASDDAVRNAYGAFYTPTSIASYLVASLGLAENARVLEPAFGDGSFLASCASAGICSAEVYGCEIDPAAVDKVIDDGLLPSSNVFRGSFFSFSDEVGFDAVVGNPPFVRMRALPDDEVRAACAYCLDKLGVNIGEESSEWYPFLLKSIAHLRKGGGIALVLPQDFTYLKYSRPAWRLLADSFSDIRVVRVRERIFKNILQDVILLVATDKGGHADSLSFECHATIRDLLEGKAPVSRRIAVSDVVEDRRPFQRALVDPGLLELLEGSPLFCRAAEEASFHIGYVCGNKGFFHPTLDAIRAYDLPDSSLVPVAVSSRQLKSVGYRTASSEAPGSLWLPSCEPTEGERRYIAYGEERGVNLGYKCRVRSPWWVVPGLARPDAILSVFGDVPKMIVNDGGWAVSNSLLGAYCLKGLSGEAFAGTWYSSVTRLSIELQVHSLGGGVLVAVPQEANHILKLRCSHARDAGDRIVEERIANNDAPGAYVAYDGVIANELGQDALEGIQRATDDLIAWRKR